MKRVEQINVRVSREEKRRLEDLARRGGHRSTADLLRVAALAHQTEPLTYTVIIHPADADEGGFWAEVPALPGCNAQGESYEQTLADAQEAIVGYVRMLRKLGEPVPRERQPRRVLKAAVRVAV